MKPKHHYRSISYLDHNEEVYNKLFSDLQLKLETQRSSVPLTQFFPAPKSPPNKHKYAEELKRQIEDKNKSKVLKKLEKQTPAISESFHGYPNLPTTPKEEKRRKLLESMLKVKDSLDRQVFSKHSIETNSKVKELEFDKKIKEENLSKLSQETHLKKEKKTEQREILTGSWNLAKQARILKMELDEIGRKGASVKREKKLEEIVRKNTSEVGKLLDFSELEQRLVQGSKTKPAKLKQPLPGNRYQARIKKIIVAAKQIRESNIKLLPHQSSPK